MELNCLTFLFLQINTFFIGQFSKLFGKRRNHTRGHCRDRYVIYLQQTITSINFDFTKARSRAIIYTWEEILSLYSSGT